MQYALTNKRHCAEGFKGRPERPLLKERKMSIFSGIHKRTADRMRGIAIDTDGDNLPDCEVQRIGQYAIYSKPLKGSSVLCLNHGNKNYSIAEYKAELQPIENLLNDGDFAIDTGVVRMHFKHLSGEVEITGAKSIKIGDGAMMSLIDERIVQFINTHTHGSPAGATTPPTVLIVKESVSTKIVKAS